MKQSKLFRTWREGKIENMLAGERRERGRDQKSVPTPAVLLMLSDARGKNAPLGTCY